MIILIVSFYNKLTDEKMDEEKYAHAQNIWNAFKIKNFRSV